jgi:cAMP-dependent protein kinase regulator
MDAFTEVRFGPNEYVFHQGDKFNGLYFQLEGTGHAVMDGQTVHHYKVGDYFGEKALLTGENRAASIITNTEASFVKITREQFIRLLGPLE